MQAEPCSDAGFGVFRLERLPHPDRTMSVQRSLRTVAQMVTSVESIEQRLISAAEDFHDPSQEWRRLFSELLGTFFLVLVAAGGGMMGQAFPDTITRTAAVVAPGLMVMAIILFMGKVSGAHLNPAVSFAFSLRGDFPWRRVPGYVVVQLAGATLACLFLHWVVNVSATYGSNYPSWRPFSPWGSSASSSVRLRAPRTSASSAPLESAGTSHSPACGEAPSRGHR
jgi:hypothetical protein